MSNLSRDNNPYLSPQFNEETAATSVRNLFIERSLWGSAVLGAIVAGARTHFWEIDQAGDIPRAANNLTFGALVGLGLVISVWVLMRRSLRTLPPGYWFAIHSLTTACALIVAMPWDSFATFESYQLIFRTSQQVLRLLLFITFAITTGAGGYWKTYAWTCAMLSTLLLLDTALGLIAASKGDESVFAFQFAIGLIGGIVQLSCPLLALISVVIDLQKRVQRDQIHWVCLGLSFINSFANFVQPFVDT